MLENLMIVMGQVAVLFLLMATGFLLGKINWMSDETSGNISRILLKVALPCVIVKSLQVPFTGQLFSALLWGGAGVAIQLAGMILLSLVTFRKVSLESQAPLRFSLVYSNSMFMGLPLLLAVFGDDAAIYTVPIVVVVQFFMWTHGVSCMGGASSFRKMILNPGVISGVIGMALFMAEITLPTPVITALGHIGNINTPLSMFVVGYQMSKTSLLSVFSNRSIYLATFLRLIVSPLLSILILFPLRGSNPLMFCSLTILSAAPVASTAASFTQQHGKNAELAAQVTTLTTAASLITLPVFAMLVKMMIGM